VSKITIEDGGLLLNLVRDEIARFLQCARKRFFVAKVARNSASLEGKFFRPDQALYL
jgi:hypothetical protein